MVHPASNPTGAGRPSSTPVQSLWIGERLGVLERLTIQSFLDHGHAVHLYLYGPCAEVPAGTVIRDGREILPASKIFTYQGGYGAGSPSGFANLFRYAMLHAQGGWWVDLDVVALRPLVFAEEHVLGTATTSGPPFVENAIIRAPAGSPLMAYCLEAAERVDRDRVRWGETGPRLVHRAVGALGMEGAVTPSSVLYPVSAERFWNLIRPGPLPPAASAMHLWAQQWRYFGLDPAARYPDASPYQQLITRHLPDVARSAGRVVSIPWLLVRSIPTRVHAGMLHRWRRWRRRRQGSAAPT
jgi:hypothetical protein